MRAFLLCLFLSGAVLAASAYDYKKALGLSLYFYEAQRTGKLPSNNRIPWRFESFANDGQHAGVDLSGGYFDAGDYVKFNLPMAGAMTVLSWSGLIYKKGYDNAGQYGQLQNAVKWGTDYFLKCHTKWDELYVQVGDGVKDHGYWGRPDAAYNVYRPVYKVNRSKKGSDVAGETSAALTAAYMLFKNNKKSYANNLLRHAKELFDLANNNQGSYNSLGSAVTDFYRSSGYKDELAWSAAWLYKATREWKYRQAAEQRYNEAGFNTWAFSWDSKIAGAAVILAQETGNQKYKNDLNKYCDEWRNGRKTQKGLRFYDQWGALRYTMNSCMICIQAADLGVDASANRNFAQKQLDYALGSTGRSFEIGFGSNYPRKPHHRASSCPWNGSCSWNHYNTGNNNPHVLKGALVGGPMDTNDRYYDDRKNHQTNEVALDYNAGFQFTLSWAAAWL